VEFCENLLPEPGTKSGGSLKKPTIQRLVALLAMTASLGACTAVQDFLAPLGSGADRGRLKPVPVEERLEPISRNYFVLESPDQSVIGEPQIVYTTEENTFSDLAREYGLGFDEMVAANPGIDPWLPGDDTPVLLPTQYVLPDVPRQGLVLNIASKRLFYFPKVAAGEPIQVLTYPIGIGRVGWETPLGDTVVVAKARDPVWYVPASVRRENAELGYGQSARALRSETGDARLPDSRHQPALWRGNAGEPRLRPALSGKYRASLRDGRHRRTGHDYQRTLSRRLA
jgi:lipoprotein-anchoring transpeptidase ErfK/SrfK